jgi:hypothetical protein
MDKDFDFEPENLDFEDNFEPEYFDEEDFDEFNDLEEFEEINVRTAVLSKNNMIALLCVKTASQGGAICRVDPRENVPSVQIYDNAEAALEWFTKSLRTSKLNGWQVVYDGLPLQG